MNSLNISRHHYGNSDNNNDPKPNQCYKRSYMNEARTRSRSRSNSPECRSSKMPHIYSNEKTANEYETRIKALTTQLAMSNGELLTVATKLETLKADKEQCENSFRLLKQVKDSLEVKNHEILAKMKTLESSVEILQKEKRNLVASNIELRKKSEEGDRKIHYFNEQMAFLNTRNSTLTKKHAELRKNCTELEKIKPELESLQKKNDELLEQNTQEAKKIADYKTREQDWIKTKNDFEEQVLGLQKQNEVILEENKQQAAKIIDYQVCEQNWIKTNADLENRVLEMTKQNEKILEEKNRQVMQIADSSALREQNWIKARNDFNKQILDLQMQIDEIQRENRSQATQIVDYSVREQNLIEAKSNLKKRTLAEMERADKAELYIQQDLALAVELAFKQAVDQRGEHVYLEQMHKLQQAFESLRAIQNNNLNRTQEKLAALEKKFHHSARKGPSERAKKAVVPMHSNKNNRRKNNRRQKNPKRI